jgi:hypothetical protein
MVNAKRLPKNPKKENLEIGPDIVGFAWQMRILQKVETMRGTSIFGGTSIY